MSEDLLLQRDGEVATLVLNRPASHNAITLDMCRALPGLLDGLDGDPAVKVIVVRGAGKKSFASGADITEFREVRADADGARRYNRAVEAAERALERLRKPTIAMVHGHCSRAQFTVRATKEIVRRSLAGQTEDDEATRELRDSSFDTDDYADGMRAFLEKRAPVFTWS